MKEGCGRQRREARDKMEKGGTEEEGVMSVVSRAEEFRPCSMGGVYGMMVKVGGRGVR